MSLSVGSVFAGEWRILARIAEGGMGAVYRVEQRSTGQLRALKVLRSSLLEDPRARARFEQESLVVARIASEHVTRVIAAGVDPDEGHPWIAMELLEGETLKRRIERAGPYGRIETLELARQLCHALAAAHDAGVIHRDVKPENVFIARTARVGAPEVVKLLDFGIATALEDFDTSATATSVLGSPLWMAPEQVRRERIRPATDVWALGLLLFYALTAKPYWRKTFPADAVIFEKMVEPLATASVRAVELGCEGAIPPGFDPWFARCVCRAIDERYRDADEAFDAFERVMTDPRMPRDLPPSRTRVIASLALATAATTTLAALAYGHFSATTPSSGGPGSATMDARAAQDAASTIASPDAPTTDAALTGIDAMSPPAGATIDAPTTDAARVRTVPDPTTSPDATSPVARGLARTIDAGREPMARVEGPTRVGSAPLVPGFSVRRFEQGSSACRGPERRAWQLVPEWFLRRRAEIRLEERARRIAQERSVAERFTDSAAREAATRSIALEEATLDRDRRILEGELQRALPSIQRTLSSLASTARCVEAGSRADLDALYALWCCR
jgi:serine/threonine protein kinase